MVLLWIGLSMWRAAGKDLMHDIEQSFREYYLRHPGEPGEAPPLVRWDFEQDTLIAVLPEEVQEIKGSDGLRDLVIK